MGNEDDAEGILISSSSRTSHQLFCIDYIKTSKKQKYSSTNRGSKSKNGDEEDGDSDDDEFFDRTKAKNGKIAFIFSCVLMCADCNISIEILDAAKTETYESLVEKRNEVEQKRQILVQELTSIGSEGMCIPNRFSLLNNLVVTASGDDDPLDAYMNSNALSMIVCFRIKLVVPDVLFLGREKGQA